MFQDETQPENHLERLTPLPLPPAAPNAEVQRKRMLIALGILLLALIAVVLKDWDFWFPPDGEVHEAAVRTKNKSYGTCLLTAAANTPCELRRAEPQKRPSPRRAATTAPETPFTATTDTARRAACSTSRSCGREPPHRTCPRKSSAIRLDVDSGGDLHIFGCGYNRLPRQIRTHRDLAAQQPVLPARPVNESGLTANCPVRERFGATRLSSTGAPDEGAGRSESAGADLARRVNPTVGDSERPGNFGGRGEGSREAVALQALLAKRAAGRNPGPDHGELHDLDKLRVWRGHSRPRRLRLFVILLLLFAGEPGPARPGIRSASSFVADKSVRAT